jgi:hypothetical protein
MTTTHTLSEREQVRLLLDDAEQRMPLRELVEAGKVRIVTRAALAAELGYPEALDLSELGEVADSLGVVLVVVPVTP